MTELHEITFRWPYTDAHNVIVTGSFDGWSSSTHLSKTPAGFEGTARVPWGTKVVYKYIVDGRWTTADGQPTEVDPIGNLNNVYSAPPAPEPKAEEAASAGVVDTVKNAVAGLSQTAAAMVEAMAPSVESPSPAADSTPAVKPTSLSSPPADPQPAPSQVEPTPTSEPVAPGVVSPPSEPAAPELAPEAPVHILPLEPAPPASTIVEGTSVDPVPATNGVNGTSKAYGGIDGENAPSTHEVAGESLVGEAKREQAMEGEPAVVVPESAEKPATNGTPALEEAKPAVNGSSEEAKPTTNGTSEAKRAPNGTPAPASPSPPTTPKEKSSRMRFPSLSARHSRRSSSSAHASLTDLGDSPTSSPVSSPSKEKLETHASRAGAGETVRRKRTSIFGKLKGIFDSPGHANGHGKPATNGA